MDDRVLEKYLAGYAEPEANAIFGHDAIFRENGQTTYEYCLTIPAYQESFEQLAQVWQDIEPQISCLIILVINSPSADEPWAHLLVNSLTESGGSSVTNGQNTLIRSLDGANGNDHQHPNIDLLIVDRFSVNLTLPEKSGVGLARKIAADMAAKLIQQQVIRTPWIFATDADAILPVDYFDITPEANDAALLYPFRHVAPASLKQASDLYELTLLYYAAGLVYAGSPYAFPTIGSTIACHVHHYAAVRGFPIRTTGEDFYLLNKLRKVGQVRAIDHSPIVIAGRESDRVPIGTGRGITKIMALESPEHDMRVEHPDCFTTLKHFLAMLDWAATTRNSPAHYHDRILAEYAEKIGLTRHIESRVQSGTGNAAVRKQITDWFDGLKSRQLVHHFRDHHHGTVSINAIDQAPFLKPGTDADIRAQLTAQILRASRY